MFEVLRDAYKNQRRIERQFSKINPKATIRVNRMLRRAEAQEDKINDLIGMLPYSMPDSVKAFVISEAKKPIIYRTKYAKHKRTRSN